MFIWRILWGSSRWTKAFFDWLGEGPCARESRGLRLLREWLSSDQLAQYEACGYFDVTGSASGKRYRVCHGTGMNIYEIDDAGYARLGWCFVPDGCLVAGDVLLAQKIALESDEGAALAVAKNFGVKAWRVPGPPM